jgi:hypothetical protein
VGQVPDLPIPVSLSTMKHQNGICSATPAPSNQKINELQLGKEIALACSVKDNMSAQGTLVAPRKYSSNTFLTLTL